VGRPLLALKDGTENREPSVVFVRRLLQARLRWAEDILSCVGIMSMTLVTCHTVITSALSLIIYV
jgi:hypothetical protein